MNELGTPNSRAASSGGTVGYPPKPTTAAGFIRRIKLSATGVPAVSIAPVRASDHGVRPRTVSLGTTSIVSLVNNPL